MDTPEVENIEKGIMDVCMLMHSALFDMVRGYLRKMTQMIA